MTSSDSSIPVSSEMRKSLKVLATQRDYSYQELLEELKQMYEAEMPFKSEREFMEWFENNYELFGFQGIVEPDTGRGIDFEMLNLEGESVMVELELMAKNFKEHGHDEGKVDEIICVWSQRDEVNGVPVTALKKVDSERKILDEVKGRKMKSLELSPEIVELFNESFQTLQMRYGRDLNQADVMNAILEVILIEKDYEGLSFTERMDEQVFDDSIRENIISKITGKDIEEVKEEYE